MSEASLIFKLLGEGPIMVYQYLKIVLCELGYASIFVVPISIISYASMILLSISGMFSVILDRKF